MVNDLPTIGLLAISTPKSPSVMSWAAAFWETLFSGVALVLITEVYCEAVGSCGRGGDCEEVIFGWDAG